MKNNHCSENSGESKGINLALSFLQRIPNARVRRKLIHKVLDLAPRVPIRTKNGFLINYNTDGGPPSTILRKHVVSGTWEQDDIAIYRKILTDGDTVIDVGAHEGFLSLLFSQFVSPNGKVFAVEPEKNNLSRLKKNVELNAANNVEIVEVAVSDQSGEMPLYYTLLDEKDSAGGSAFGSLHDHPLSSYNRQVMVQVKTLDSLFKDLKEVKLLKTDTEGHELEVLRGAEDLLRRTKPVLSFEANLTIWADMTSTISTLFNFVRKMGYELYVPEKTRLANFEWLKTRVMNIFAVHKDTKQSPFYSNLFL